MSSQFNFGSVPTLNSNTTTSAFSFSNPTTNTVAALPSATTSSGFSFGSTANPLQTTLGSTLGQPLGQQLGQPLGQQMGQPLGQQMGQPLGQQMGQPLGQQMGQPLSQQLGQTMGPNPTLTLTTASTAVTQTTTQQTNTFHGLGGTQTTSSESSADQSLKANKANKELSFIPPEMMPIVEALKQFVKEQKVIREENSQQRFSIQPILEVGSEIEDSLKLLLNKIEVDIQRNVKSIDVLKRDTNRLLSSAEMAYRISRVDFPQTPSSYTMAQNKYINASTHQYFVDLIDNFELQMNNYSKQIQELRTHIDNMNKPYNSEELLQIMRKQHETLISLAAKVYAVHEDINQLKLNVRNQNIYLSKSVEMSSEPKTNSVSNDNQSFVGPNPFGLTGDDRTFGTTVPQNLSSNSQMFVGSGAQTLASNISSPLNPLPTPGVQFSPSTSTINSSHSRAKRWTTS